jgi:hypothetical protein
MMMARKLLEQYRRRADFVPENCMGIKLADGQEWHFSKPWLTLIPAVQGKEIVGFGRYTTFGDDLDRFLEAIARDEDPLEQIRHVLMLGICVLDRNYDLTSEELGRLFTYRSGDPASETMLKELISLATGGASLYYGLDAARDPKASVAGCG